MAIEQVQGTSYISQASKLEKTARTLAPSSAAVFDFSKELAKGKTVSDALGVAGTNAKDLALEHADTLKETFNKVDCKKALLGIGGMLLLPIPVIGSAIVGKTWLDLLFKPSSPSKPTAA